MDSQKQHLHHPSLEFNKILVEISKTKPLVKKKTKLMAAAPNLYHYWVSVQGGSPQLQHDALETLRQSLSQSAMRQVRYSAASSKQREELEFTGGRLTDELFLQLSSFWPELSFHVEYTTPARSQGHRVYSNGKVVSRNIKRQPGLGRTRITEEFEDDGYQHVVRRRRV